MGWCKPLEPVCKIEPLTFSAIFCMESRDVLQAFSNNNCILKYQECQIFQTELVYLNHVITQNRIAPNPEYIRGIIEIPFPTNRKDMKSFLSKCSYYQNFCENLQVIVAPLSNLVHGLDKQTSKIQSTPESIEAFIKVKSILVNAPILGYPDLTSGHTGSICIWTGQKWAFQKY